MSWHEDGAREASNADNFLHGIFAKHWGSMRRWGGGCVRKAVEIFLQSGSSEDTKTI